MAAIEAGFQTDEIEQAAYEYTKSIDDGERMIVGVNRFVEEVEPEPEVFPIDPALQREQVERVKIVRATAIKPRSLGALDDVARRGPGNAEPAAADAGGVVAASHARRGQRRAARRVRGLPPHPLAHGRRNAPPGARSTDCRAKREVPPEAQRRTAPRCQRSAPKVSQLPASPLSNPTLNHRTRCSDEPCVHVSWLMLPVA